MLLEYSSRVRPSIHVFQEGRLLTEKGNLMLKWNNYNQLVENKYQQIDNLFATPAGGFH